MLFLENNIDETLFYFYYFGINNMIRIYIMGSSLSTTGSGTGTTGMSTNQMVISSVVCCLICCCCLILLGGIGFAVYKSSSGE